MEDCNECDECGGTGWVENAVEGKTVCVCIFESDPFQVLMNALTTLSTLGNGGKPGNSIGNEVAIEALKKTLGPRWRQICYGSY